MKQILLFLTIIFATNSLLQAQNRIIARGAEPGELYLTGLWYGIGAPWGYPFYDTVRMAIYRMTENGKKLTVQYDAGYLSDNPEYIVIPDYIIADATPGALYNKQIYFKNSSSHTALWISFDYGENWMLRQDNIGSVNFFSANYEGMIYRSGPLKSTDYGTTFFNVEGGIGSQGEFGWEEKEIFAVGAYNSYDGVLYHTYDLYKSYIEIPIDSLFIFGQISGIFPDVYRGGLPGEVYISSWFPDWTYKVSFSADTGYTFRHAFISETYDPYNSYLSMPFFMSDREPGVFYIIRTCYVDDTNPLGWHRKVCIEYYRDYGEILEATFCHDITKNYEYEDVICAHDTYLDSHVYLNSIQLQWSNSAESSDISGYHVYRNNSRITSVLLTDTLYLDENLLNGNYEYYVRSYYKIGCVSDSSNHVSEIVNVKEDCELVNDLISEKINDNNILLSWSEPESDLQIEGYRIYRNNTILTNEFVLALTYLDENLPNGTYNYYVITHYTNSCISDSSNHVIETIELGINEFFDEITVYPNPTTGTLQVTSDELQVTSVEIFDVYGRKLINFQFSILNSQLKIDISHLQAGIYFAKITTERGITISKIAKY